jgi:hypothetical protein
MAQEGYHTFSNMAAIDNWQNLLLAALSPLFYFSKKGKKTNLRHRSR